MWCTRWFLPLLLLPLPTTSPYFLFLFFFSLTLHARPCFYCIILLTALFTSSCYWQPVPTRALFQAAFPNVSSSSPLLYFSNSSMSEDNAIPMSQLSPVPKLTTLLDRCWCDLSGGHLFDPYNMTLWQLTSLSRTLGATKSQRVLVAQEAQMSSSQTDLEQPAEPLETHPRVWVLRMMGKDELPSEEEGVRVPFPNSTIGSWFRPSLSFLLPLKPFLSFPFNVGHPPSNDSTEESPPDAPRSSSSPEILDTTAGKVQLPLIRRTYDLRVHGVDLVIDFGWGRKHG